MSKTLAEMMETEFAFPGQICVGHDGDDERPIYRHPPGMTLLDYFAGQALAGIVTARDLYGMGSDIVAAKAYDYASAMIAEKNRREDSK